MLLPSHAFAMDCQQLLKNSIKKVDALEFFKVVTKNSITHQQIKEMHKEFLSQKLTWQEQIFGLQEDVDLELLASGTMVVGALAALVISVNILFLSKTLPNNFDIKKIVSFLSPSCVATALFSGMYMKLDGAIASNKRKIIRQIIEKKMSEFEKQSPNINFDDVIHLWRMHIKTDYILNK